jgi:hypothetical protein
MKAIVCDGYGPPADVLRFTDIDEPVVAGDEVLVRVHAASVNPADWHLVRGQPYIARLSYGMRKPRSRVPGAMSPDVREFSGYARRNRRRLSSPNGTTRTTATAQYSPTATAGTTSPMRIASP